MMDNQIKVFAIIVIVAALSVAAIVPAMMSTTMAFSRTGDPHDRPGNSDSDGDPHGPGNSPGSSGNPHFCPDDQCD